VSTIAGNVAGKIEYGTPSRQPTYPILHPAHIQAVLSQEVARVLPQVNSSIVLRHKRLRGLNRHRLKAHILRQQQQQKSSAYHLHAMRLLRKT
jgi:hypothetical protein